MISHLHNEHWIMGGDFNVSRWSFEKSGAKLKTTSMDLFNKFIDDCSLVGPPISNGKYTWFNYRKPPLL